MQITVITATSISFHGNPNLRSLEISSFGLHPSTPRNTAWLQAIIATVTSHSFEELTLWFNVFSGVQKEWVEEFDFQSLEQNLLQRADPLALPVVHTKFVQSLAWMDSNNDWLVATVERQLPELHKRGLLVVYPKGRPLTKALDGWQPYLLW
jgi:hypothetical protein